MKSPYVTVSAEAYNDNGGHDSRYDIAVLSIARLVARYGPTTHAAAAANANNQPKENAS